MTTENQLATPEIAAIQRATAISPVMTVQQAVKQFQFIQEIVKTAMIQGHDYGLCPGTSKGMMLKKPGAEKLCGIFGLAVTVAQIARDADLAVNFIEYTVTVELVSKNTGLSCGQGIGLCNSHERKYKNQDAHNIANTLLKMAKKRAVTDAVLGATGASGIFDMDEDEIEAPQARNGRAPAPPEATAEQVSEIKKLAAEYWGDGWAKSLIEWRAAFKGAVSQDYATETIAELRKMLNDATSDAVEGEVTDSPA